MAKTKSWRRHSAAHLKRKANPGTSFGSAQSILQEAAATFRGGKPRRSNPAGMSTGRLLVYGAGAYVGYRLLTGKSVLPASLKGG